MHSLNLAGASAYDVRATLRQRLSTQLPTSTPFKDRGSYTQLTDEVMLRLLMDVTINDPSDRGRFRSNYTVAALGVADAPTFEDLISQGWVSVWMNRVQMSRVAREEMRRDKTEALVPLNTVAEALYTTSYHFSSAVLNDPEIGDQAKSIVEGTARWMDLRCRRPEWVAARLWEETRTQRPQEVRLREWLDRWDALHSPSLIISDAWGEEDAAEFREACLKTLADAAAQGDWVSERGRIVNFLRHRYSAKDAADSGADAAVDAQAQAESRVPDLPNTLVERAGWLENTLFESFEIFLFGGPFQPLAWLLLKDLAAADPVTADLSGTLVFLENAAASPVLLQAVITNVQREPLLLADLMGAPTTAPLAIRLITRWTETGGWTAHSNRALEASRRRGKEEALSDGLTVLSEMIQTRPPGDDEVAAVLVELQEHAMDWRDRGAVAERALQHVRSYRAAWPRARLQGISDALLERPADGFLQDPPLVALLEHTREGGVTSDVQATAIIDRYAAAVRPGAHNPDVQGYAPALCAHLYNLSGSVPGLAARFLSPFDGPALIVSVSGDDRYIVRQRVAVSLRSHIRILTRAIVGLEGPTPEDLVKGLLDAVWAGALDHSEKGRTNAFSPRFERGPLATRVQQPSLATDLARALVRLPTAARNKLLHGLTETDEPYILAQLLDLTTGQVWDTVQTRLQGLTPDRASDVTLVTDNPARIDALLEADLIEAAEAYLDQHRKHAGGKPDRDVEIFGIEARILAARTDLAGLIALSEPVGLLAHQKDSVRDTREFYRALTLHRRQGHGDIEEAHRIFRRLQDRRPYIYAYQQNAIAMEISLLTNSRPFDRLQASSIPDARKLVLEAEHLRTNLEAQPLALLAGNLAWLQLMLGEPDTALSTLSDANPVAPITHAVRIAALHDLGRAREAFAALDQARLTWPDDGMIEAARLYLDGQSPSGSLAVMLGGVDTLPAVRSALTALRNLDFQTQALAWGYESVDALLLEQVRQAGAGLSSLRSAMRKLGLDTLEDDISRVFQTLVRGRLAPLGWSIGDQSLGGYTAKGNPGERDLVIYHGSMEVSVIEAVVCKSPMTNSSQVEDLRFHFTKLFAYTKSRTLFHVTFSRTPNQAAILRELERIAKEEAPHGYAFQAIHDLPAAGDAPAGLVARFRDDRGDLTLTFLVIDLEQAAQKAAAATSGKRASSKHRVKPGDAKPKATGGG